MSFGSINVAIDGSILPVFAGVVAQPAAASASVHTMNQRVTTVMAPPWVGVVLCARRFVRREALIGAVFAQKDYAVMAGLARRAVRTGLFILISGFPPRSDPKGERIHATWLLHDAHASGPPSVRANAAGRPRGHHSRRPARFLRRFCRRAPD